MTATGWTTQPASARPSLVMRQSALDASRCWRRRFEGAFEYHDAQMYMPERIALENLIDADAHGAAIANYVAAGKLLLRTARSKAARRTKHDRRAFDIRARRVLVAAGPGPICSWNRRPASSGAQADPFQGHSSAGAEISRAA
jgi:glycerol-3-phosphate dehydrogenase